MSSPSWRDCLTKTTTLHACVMSSCLMMNSNTASIADVPVGLLSSFLVQVASTVVVRSCCCGFSVIWDEAVDVNWGHAWVWDIAKQSTQQLIHGYDSTCINMYAITTNESLMAIKVLIGCQEERPYNWLVVHLMSSWEENWYTMKWKRSQVRSLGVCFFYRNNLYRCKEYGSSASWMNWSWHVKCEPQKQHNFFLYLPHSSCMRRYHVCLVTF